jgi:hypothetical protein
MVDDHQLKSLEGFLTQSLRGHHHLFDKTRLKQVLKDPQYQDVDVRHDQLDELQKILTGLMNRTSMSEKQSYMDSLTESQFNLLVRAYFQIVDSTLQASKQELH